MNQKYRLRSGRKNRRAKEIEFEEVFLDKYSRDKCIKTGVSAGKLEVPLAKINFVVLFLFALAVFAVLGFSTFNLQVAKGDEYEKMAQQNKFLVANLKSERGIIYDANMNSLVKNEASFGLWAHKAELELPSDKLIEQIAWIAQEDSNELKNKLSASEEEDALLIEHLNHQTIVFLESRKDDFTGFYVKRRIVRHYEKVESLSHILGYLGKISAEEMEILEERDISDYTGKEGIERWYEDVLKEKKGKLQIERTAAGAEISREIVSQPKSGDSLMLFLDLGLQKTAETALKAVLDEVGSGKGAVLAIDPRSGGVLASVSLPGFDNNLFSQGISIEEFKELNENPLNPQLNRVIAGLYPLGSTAKPMIAAAALEEDVITASTQIYCPLELCIPHTYTGEGQCFPDWTFHGWSDIKRALAESVNPFFYIVGGGYSAPNKTSEFYDERLPKKLEGLGQDTIAEYFRYFGLGERAGIDLPGEAEGRVPTTEWKADWFNAPEDKKWHLGDTYNLSIGQGYLLSTPLQLGVAVSSLANNGKVIEPRFAKAVLKEDQKEPEYFEPKIIRTGFLSDETIDIVKQGMRQAVSSPSGSAYSLNYLPVNTAAKTGTAQIYPNREVYHNWIAAFAPYDNPEIVLIVLIEEVEGMKIAAQKVAKDVLKWYFSQ